MKKYNGYDELSDRKQMQHWAGSKKFHDDNDKRIADLEKAERDAKKSRDFKNTDSHCCGKPQKQINEIGDTENGMYAIGQVAGRAYDRMLNSPRNKKADGIVALDPKYGKVAQDAAYAAAGGYIQWKKKFEKANGREPSDKEIQAYMQNYHNGSHDYGKSETERKGVVKLSESQLRAVIAESVKKVIKEYGYDAYPDSGYEGYTKLGERAAYWVMDELRRDNDVDSEAISRIISSFGYSLKALADVGDVDNGVRGFGIKS